MPRYQIQADDIDPLLEGLAILGTGGGGSPEWGRAILRNDLERGRELWIVDPDDIEDDALVVSGGIMGSVKTFESMDIAQLVKRWESSFELLRACQLMESFLGRKVDYVVPFEAGGLNTPVVMSWAARMSIACIDGDGLGRSAPRRRCQASLPMGFRSHPCHSSMQWVMPLLWQSRDKQRTRTRLVVGLSPMAEAWGPTITTR